MNTPLQASIVITTYNRKDDLRKAIQSAQAQDVPCEILVMDDASSDGTSDMVAKEFPNIRLLRSQENLGLVAQRNKAAAAATTPFIFSLDDDAEFSKPSIVRETLADFDDPRIGAVGIPLIDVNRGSRLSQKAPNGQGIYILANFFGAAHALRKEIFLRAGGYSGIFYRQGEERDFCIQMLDLGYFVRAGRSAPVFHYESPVRDHDKIARYGPRNNVLICWRSSPWFILAPHICSVAAKNCYDSWRKGKLLQAARGLWEACRLILARRVERRSVSWATFMKFRMLRKKAPIQLNSL